MSVIETPPRDRLAIQTSIVKFSTDVIAAAIRQELGREGQVFIVHNRVESIYSLASLVQRLVPEARVAVAHGQMPEAELERVMLAFVEGRADVLVATTIVENGLDIPRANTLVVNRADRYGLAQLYQLRGRVGRSDRRAFAYLLVPPDTVLSEIARKRLAAIREFSDLGAGFRIAALDLELRGAGNLLGGQQSGHIQAVGLDLYVKLLEQAILELRGEPSREAPRAALHLRVEMRIPPSLRPGDASAPLDLQEGQPAAKGRGRPSPAGRAARPLRVAPARGGGAPALRRAARPRRRARRRPGGRDRGRTCRPLRRADSDLGGRSRPGDARAAGGRTDAGRVALASRWPGADGRPGRPARSPAGRAMIRTVHVCAHDRPRRGPRRGIRASPPARERTPSSWGWTASASAAATSSATWPRSRRGLKRPSTPRPGEGCSRPSSRSGRS